jgi:hypothetical protein
VTAPSKIICPITQPIPRELDASVVIVRREWGDAATKC